MQEFSLKLESQINGIYLNSETIELLSIIQCKNIEELKDFAINCSQLNISEEDLTSWNDNDIEDIKRMLVEQYKSTLVSMEQSIKNRRSVLELALKHSGITADEVDSYISVFQNNGYEGIKKKLKAEHPESYDIFTEKAHRFIGTERDQMTSITFEELSGLNDILSNHNTLLIGAGRYYDVTKKMYDEHIPNMEKYDFYYAQRGLDFCYKNGMYARYHTLLDKQTMEEHLIGKQKEYVLGELQKYVKKSIDFISKYNEEHKINGKGVICSVDLLNEIISFDEPYRNMWQELYGISNEELVSIFQYALENKPDGVTYVYNEPFLENPERRQVVIEQLSRINELAPGLIDTIGTQMHIEMTQNIDDIRQCFEDFKRLEQLGIGTQITEFDMCLPERFMFDENGKIRSEQDLVELINSKISKSGITIGSIAEFKSMRMDEISKAIEETGVQLDGITYWSISDTLDHNLERTNRKTYEQGLQREIAQTRYAGLYSGLERNQTIMLENKKMYVRKNLESQKNSLTKYKTMYDEAIKSNETRKAEVYGSRVEKIKRRINELENQLSYMREDIPEDLEERKKIRQSFSNQVAEIIPDGIPMVFHGNNDIATIYEILKSGGLKTPEERGVDFKSFATQIDVANKHDIHVPVEFADPGIDSARPYGAIFAFFPKKDEIYKGLENFGSEVPGGVQSIDFKEDDDRFVGIITTEENKERIQKWLQEFGMDYKKIFTHLEFIEMCKDRFKDSQLTNGQKLGKQVVDEISDTILIDETERTIESQERDLDKTKENQATIGG